jgi:membrane-bound lytic murein transglycosylase D
MKYNFIILNLLLGACLNAFALDSKFPEDLWSPPIYGEQKAAGYDAYTFAVPKSLEGEVNFWVKIYTKYTSQQGLFHLAGQTDKILGEIDMTALYRNPKWGPIRKEIEAEKFVKSEQRRLAAKLKIKNVKNVRFQRGLADRMREAIIISGQYLPMMEKIFREEKIPIELTRLVFVESSFNVDAKSRVGASGLWQIMPNIGRKFKYLQKSFDKRDHPYYATKLAAKILRENYMILKNWPLAVTSYNYGVGSMLKVKKKLDTKDIEVIFGGKKENPYIGFASRNFYATFLAALHVESHANIYFGEPFLVKKHFELKNVYLENEIKFKELLVTHKLDKNQFVLLNPHIKSKYLKLDKKMPKGTLITVPETNKLASDQTDD